MTRHIVIKEAYSAVAKLVYEKSPSVVEVVGKVGHLKSKVFHFGWPVEGREGVINLVISNLKSFTPYHHHQLNQSEGLTI